MFSIIIILNIEKIPSIWYNMDEECIFIKVTINA